MWTDNYIRLSGTVEESPVFAYSCYCRNFYRFMISVPRLSGNRDVLPVHIDESQRLPFVEKGEGVTVEGEMRSCNRIQEGRSRLLIYVFSKHIQPSQSPGENRVQLNGHLCRGTACRLTPFGRQICDVLLAVRRSNGRSDYIPVITWGVQACAAGKMSVGDEIHVEGRFQSREYEKCLMDGCAVKRTAYEVSACGLSRKYPSE